MRTPIKLTLEPKRFYISFQNILFGLAQDGSDTPENQGDEPRPICHPGALCPDVSRPIAPGQKASPRSTPILTPLQFLFGDL